MSPKTHRPVSDADWNQLMTLAAGYLVLEDGDVKAAMSRAIAAHTELIKALKAELITAPVGKGTVTMFVPEEGGVALRLERPEPAQPFLSTPPADEPTNVDPVLPNPTSTYYMDEDE